MEDTVNRNGCPLFPLYLHILLYAKGREIVSPWKVRWNLIFITFLKFVLALSRSTLRGFGSGSLTFVHVETCIEISVEAQEETGNSSAELKEAFPEERPFQHLFTRWTSKRGKA